MEGNSLFSILFGVILLGYVFLYFKGRHYLIDSFQSGSGAGAGAPLASERNPAPLPGLPSPDAAAEERGSCPKTGKVLMEYITPDTVAKQSIQSVGDYELNYVFQEEADREVSQALKNKLMSQYPLDWSAMPPSSAKFQAGLRESFENAKPSVPSEAMPYANEQNVMPPDTELTEMEERKILQTYKPVDASKLPSYKPDEETPEELIQKLYAVKGLVPTVAHKEGTNVYEIIGVRRKDEKIVYEDEEAPASTAAVRGAGEATINVPPAAWDTAAAKDPYYDMSGRTRTGKWDYQAWTPGLERMFAPTNGQTNWY